MFNKIANFNYFNNFYFKFLLFYKKKKFFYIKNIKKFFIFNNKNEKFKNLLVIKVFFKCNKKDLKFLFEMIFNIKIIFINIVNIKNNYKKIYIKFFLID